MKILLLGVLAVLVAALSPTAAHTIRSDRGGNLGEYADRYAALAARGERVVVDGLCTSACTLVLALPGTCVTPRARFGFHSARKPSGRASREGNAYLWAHYPARVRAWLAARGGLGARVRWLAGAASGLPPCR